MICRLLGLTVVVTFFTGILQSLFAPMVLSFSDAATLGAIQSIAASGMLLSSGLIGLSSKTHDHDKALTLSLFAAGVFYLLIGASTQIVLLTGAAFCFFFTLPFVNGNLEVLYRGNIDNEMQGRVWSLISLISQSGMLVAFGVAGVLTDRVFIPLLADNHRLSDILGSMIGAGAARGSGLMVVVSGSLLLLVALFLRKEAWMPS